MKAEREFRALNMAILTISDTRTLETDGSGDTLVPRLTEAGHQLAERALLPDDMYRIRALVAHWIAEPGIEAVITTGGTGLTGRDRTPETISPLFDKHIVGFGELFRSISYTEIGTSTMESRALAGVANGTVVFCLPGSTNACRTAWDKILKEQLDQRHKPCNVVQLIARFKEV